MANTSLGFGIVGTGTIARVHAAALRDIPNARLVIGSSRSSDNAQTFAHDFDCQATDNFRDVLAHR